MGRYCRYHNRYGIHPSRSCNYAAAHLTPITTAAAGWHQVMTTTYYARNITTTTSTWTTTTSSLIHRRPQYRIRYRRHETVYSNWWKDQHGINNDSNTRRTSNKYTTSTSPVTPHGNGTISTHHMYTQQIIGDVVIRWWCLKTVLAALLIPTMEVLVSR